jgi:hypothetical protein
MNWDGIHLQRSIVCGCTSKDLKVKGSKIGKHYFINFFLWGLKELIKPEVF